MDAEIALPSLAEFAEELAAAARAVTCTESESSFAVEDKSESGALDPVTEADRGAERAMRLLIEQRFPHHGVAGEEFADRSGEGPMTWSLDPIDGTRAFMCGLPSWTTLIGLLEKGRPVLGLIDAPRLGETYIGYGETAYLKSGTGRHILRTSGCRTLRDARLATTDPFLFSGPDGEAFERVRNAARLTRFGWDAYGYARIAAGTIDLVVESGLKPHDYNALVPVIRGAGGSVANWRGGADLGEGRIVAAASRELLEETCALLGDQS